MKNQTLIVAALLCSLTSMTAFAATETTTATEDPGFFSPERWGASYLNSITAATLKNNTIDPSSLHYLTLKHKLKGWSFGGTFVAESIYTGEDATAAAIADSYLRTTAPSIKTGKVSISPHVRFYLPTSEDSKAKESNGILQFRITASGSRSRWDFFYQMRPTFYMSRKSSETTEVSRMVANQSNPAGPPVMETYAQESPIKVPRFALSNYLGATYNTSDKFAVDFTINPGWSVSRTGDISDSSFNDISSFVGVIYKPVSGVSINPYINFKALDFHAKQTTLYTDISVSLF